jgi:hypothetical protein
VSYGWRDVDGTFVEVCDECGFDARTVDDEAASFEAVFTALDELVAHEAADRKPSEEIWSAREYVAHCIEVTEAILGYVTDRLGDEPAACPDLDASRAAVAARQASLTAEDRAAVIEDVYPFPVSGSCPTCSTTSSTTSSTSDAGTPGSCWPTATARPPSAECPTVLR